MSGFDELDEITRLLANTTLREELPGSYAGNLENEFEAIVALNELACTFMVGKEPKKANTIHGIISSLVLLINKLYFSMSGEKAPRFSEDDVELAQAHAVNNIPVESGLNLFVVDQDAMDRASRATSNICTEMLENINFVVSEFRQANKKAKEQCKRAMKYSTKITTLIKGITKALDEEEELKHTYMDKSTITYSDMTGHERKLANRKRRNR